MFTFWFGFLHQTPFDESKELMTSSNPLGKLHNISEVDRKLDYIVHQQAKYIYICIYILQKAVPGVL